MIKTPTKPEHALTHGRKREEQSAQNKAVTPLYEELTGIQSESTGQNSCRFVTTE
jgi:hypothetical protein